MPDVRGDAALQWHEPSAGTGHLPTVGPRLFVCRGGADVQLVCTGFSAVSNGVWAGCHSAGEECDVHAERWAPVTMFIVPS